MNEKEMLINSLKSSGILRSKKIENVFRKIDRRLFVPEDLKESAYVDAPLPIPGNVTISAPHMHVMCLEELNLKKGEKFLEVGAGSGIMLAYAYELVRERNKVFGIEINEEAYEFGLENLKRAGYLDKVKLILGDGGFGLPTEAPFDKILISAASPDVPKPLLEQLKNGGILLFVLDKEIEGQFLTKVKKLNEKSYDLNIITPVSFVRLKGKYGFQSHEKDF
ncbi:MAG: protein-L-isoaspartate O-methyltransferase [Candidatus Aenigmarchaeota archaeon]|nr:protein-L-isoaspartate O-methyltransferase [Candidatus Aenigmarchaeota archaeon]MDW8160135.1 protein-L-isoaspartate O-methyltransferase [Candidatus Aenigmarchaeota archaeon]